MRALHGNVMALLKTSVVCKRKSYPELIYLATYAVLVPTDNSFKLQPRCFTHFHWTISVSLYILFNFSSFLMIDEIQIWLYLHLSKQFIIQKPVINTREIFSWLTFVIVSCLFIFGISDTSLYWLKNW